MDISDRSKRYIGFSAVANKGTSTQFFLKCPGTMSFLPGPKFQDSMANDRLTWGGTAFGENIVAGDYIQIDAVDHDNILGAGVDYVLKTFNETSTISVFPTSGNNTVNKVSGIFLNPSGVTNLDSPIPSRLYGGMWLRFTYVSVGQISDPKIFVNINWDKQNT